MHPLVIGLLVAAGAALVAQNLVMAHITRSVSTVLITLVTNSAVGLVALLALLVARSGLAGIGEAVSAFRPWSVLPGLLGSLFVFASVCGYQRLGAVATIAVLVASQLVFGLAVDIVRTDVASVRSYLPAVAGAVLLVVGAVLVLVYRPC